MSIKQDNKGHVELAAKEILEKFREIAQIVGDKLKNGTGLSQESFVTFNTFTSSTTMAGMDSINRENTESLFHLRQSPANARVTVRMEDGKSKSYYVCRAAQGLAEIDVISYRTPVGKLGSLEVGDEYLLPNGERLEVIEYARLNPVLEKSVWDSRNTTFENDRTELVSIESLLELLRSMGMPTEQVDLLAQRIAEEAESKNILIGIRRQVLAKMQLRDQPFVDKYQDEIFRLPINTQLLIMGPPGTGKTTTLIKRLSQKLDSNYLQEYEKEIGIQIRNDGGAHRDSWLMFTPTALLKLYLKEAFAKEHVPAPDQRLKTWSEYRLELARNVFPILRAPGNPSKLVKRDGHNLLPATIGCQNDWFEEFQASQHQQFAAEIGFAATELANNKNAKIAGFGTQLQTSIAGSTTLTGLLTAIAKTAESLQEIVDAMARDTTQKIDEALNLQMNRDDTFIGDLGNTIANLTNNAATENEDVEDVDDIDGDDEEIIFPQHSVSNSKRAYSKALKAHARAHVAHRPLGKETRNGKLMLWIGARGLAEQNLDAVGASLHVQTNARRFKNPLKRYLDGMGKRYITFRKASIEKGLWYSKSVIKATDIYELELDAILLATLRASNTLLSSPMIMRELDLARWSSLKAVAGLHKNQILVDEVTDFSPLQIGCMAALSNPRINSFFACGDFNQRITSWGSRSLDDLKNVIPDLQLREVNIAYRQSQQLTDLAHAISQIDGQMQNDAKLPKNMENQGFAPVLLEHASELIEEMQWLAQRIVEIETAIRTVPTIAIFVMQENQVELVAQTLEAHLLERNITVTACPKGQVVGQDSDVRIFDIQHIKGLEFEAVFFLQIDELARLQTQLFDKYLYVGISRAATYLGITCRDALPPMIEHLRSRFIENWTNT